MNIREENIEIILFDYAEGNLDAQEQEKVEQFLASHPQYKEMLAMYQENETIAKPTDIVFEGKDEMFEQITGNKAKKTFLIPAFVKWASAIAAVVLLFFCIRDLIPSEEKQLGNTIAQNSKIETKKEFTETKIQETEIKKEKIKTKTYFSETKNGKTETNEEFCPTEKTEEQVLIAEDNSQNVIIESKEEHLQLAEEIITNDNSTTQERILYMRYEESIVIKEERKPTLALRVARRLKLDEKIEEFYNSELVSNTREFINIAKSLGNKKVKTTTTEIRQEGKINV